MHKVYLNCHVIFNSMSICDLLCIMVECLNSEKPQQGSQQVKCHPKMP